MLQYCREFVTVKSFATTTRIIAKHEEESKKLNILCIISRPTMKSEMTLEFLTYSLCHVTVLVAFVLPTR